MMNRQTALYILSVGSALVPLASGCKAPEPAPASVSSVRQGIISVSGMGHYCSLLNTFSGAWDFQFNPSGGDPCGTLGHGGFGGQIARAGLYSAEASNIGNNLVVRCSGGYVKTYPDQQYPLVDNQALAQIKTATQNLNLTSCVFTMAPKRLPIFDSPIPFSPFGPAYGFDFTRPPYLFGQTSCPNSFFASITNYAGQDKTCALYAKDDSDGYFWQTGNIGGPLYAVAPGVVKKVRRKETPCCDSQRPEQGELYVEHSVMSGSTNDPNYERYIEKFISAYYHIDTSLVAEGDTVTPSDGEGNRISIATVGWNGCSQYMGVGFSVYRLTNTAYKYQEKMSYYSTAGDPSNNGYKFAIDPYGFSGASFDPWSYLAFDEGRGALSINLWKTGQAPLLGNW